MNRIKPKKLNKGDLIGIINPASPVSDFNRINKSVEYFEKLGYKVKLGKNIEKQSGFKPIFRQIILGNSLQIL